MNDRLINTALGLLSTLALVNPAPPAKAQQVPLTPAILTSYAKLGAATTGLSFIRKGDRASACVVYQHLQQIELQQGAPAEDHAATQQLVNQNCGGY